MKKMNNDIFPFNTISFLNKLAKNNNREWFLAHKEDYVKHFLEPAQIAVLKLGEFLQNLRPNIIAIPEVNKSIFRIQMDTRFSKNKVPYKTNLGLYFWEGYGKKLESSGFYFHIEPNYFLLAVGFYIFPKNTLQKYREVLLLQKNTDVLFKILKKLKDKGYSIEEQKYKKLPKGFTENHPLAYYSKFSGLYAMYQTHDYEQFRSKDIIYFSKKTFKDMLPLHDWIIENIY